MCRYRSKWLHIYIRTYIMFEQYFVESEIIVFQSWRGETVLEGTGQRSWRAIYVVRLMGGKSVNSGGGGV